MRTHCMPSGRRDVAVGWLKQRRWLPTAAEQMGTHAQAAEDTLRAGRGSGMPLLPFWPRVSNVHYLVDLR